MLSEDEYAALDEEEDHDKCPACGSSDIEEAEELCICCLIEYADEAGY